MTTLYRKYRPTLFQEISGQEYVIKTLTNAIKNSQVSHAYLFTGPRGTGKTTTARIFAKTVNCLKPITKTGNDIVRMEPCNKCENCQTILKNQAIDLIEIDAASHTGVDNIRQLKESINIPPTNFKYKVYIIDEVHMLSMGAFNALLKTLEEPPAHAIFILATTELHKVPDTILSRCQRFNIKPLTKDQIIARLKQIADSEKVKIDRESLELISTEASGGMRDAESLLGQIISLGDKKITANDIREILGSSAKDTLPKMVEMIVKNNLPGIIALINDLQTSGINVKTFTNQLLNYFRDLLLLKISPENNEELLKKLTTEELSKLKTINQNFNLQNLIIIISLLQTSQKNFAQSDIPQLPLEMAMVEYFLKISPPKNSALKKNSAKTKTEPIIKSEISKPSFKQATTKSTPPQEEKSTNNKSVKKNTDSIKKNNLAKQVKSIKKLDIDIKTVLDNWSEILAEIKNHHQSISALLQNCAPVRIDGNSLLIKTKYPFHKEKLNETNNRLTTEEVFAKILKVPLKAKFITADEMPPELKDDNSNNTTDESDLLYEAMKQVGGKLIKK